MAQVIGKNMPQGGAGAVTRQADVVIDSHALTGDTAIPFGTALVYDGTGGVRAFQHDNTAEQFVGIAVKEIKSASSYTNQNYGEYLPKDAVSVLKRGCVNMICHVGTPVLGGKVYIRVALNSAKPTGIIGGLEAEPDTTAGKNNVELPNCRWYSGMDINRVAELRLLEIHN